MHVLNKFLSCFDLLLSNSISFHSGINMIGRNLAANINIPSKVNEKQSQSVSFFTMASIFCYQSLSKDHACIEVDGDVHLIYDKGSRNKTRRGKVGSQRARVRKGWVPLE